jgi:hypothetical protein
MTSRPSYLTEPTGDGSGPLVRIYYCKGPIGPGAVHVLGGNCGWVEEGCHGFNVRVKNLIASGHVVFTSQSHLDPSWDINGVIREQTGATYPPGFYEF